MAKSNIIITKEHWESIKLLPDKGRLDVIDSIMEHSFESKKQKQTALKGVAEIVFKSVIQTIKSTRKSNSNNETDDFLNQSADIVIEYLSQLSERPFGNSETNRKEIRARLKENWTVEQMKKIVEVKTYEWKNDPTMFKYLTPVTLFRKSNIEKYWELVTFAEQDPNLFKQKIKATSNGKPNELSFEERVRRQFNFIEKGHF